MGICQSAFFKRKRNNAVQDQAVSVEKKEDLEQKEAALRHTETKRLYYQQSLTSMSTGRSQKTSLKLPTELVGISDDDIT